MSGARARAVKAISPSARTLHPQLRPHHLRPAPGERTSDRDEKRIIANQSKGDSRLPQQPKETLRVSRCIEGKTTRHSDINLLQQQTGIAPRILAPVPHGIAKAFPLPATSSFTAPANTAKAPRCSAAFADLQQAGLAASRSSSRYRSLPPFGRKAPGGHLPPQGTRARRAAPATFQMNCTSSQRPGAFRERSTRP